MTLDTLFPLAIYYTDLPDARQHKISVLNAILDSETQGFEKRNYEGRAWTGDIHGAQRIHQDDRLAWIFSAIEEHTRLYLQELGLDLSSVDLYIQRAWGVISRPGQEVGPHCHPTSNVSGVYYISVPNSGAEDAGCLVFFDDDRRNEVSPGIGSDNTEILTAWNAYNQDQAAYAPTEGRLILFPSKQRHAVATNETEGDRVSISFDIVLTAKEGMAAGSYEFLTPPPSAWKQFT
jgi:uncharacterized protein (TIGR02466 family)